MIKSSRHLLHVVVVAAFVLISATALVGAFGSGVSGQTVASTDVDASELAGNGTVDDPYVMTNASELQAMEDDLDANYVLGKDIDASETADWNDSKGFDPVGEFTGSFDGAGHSITGLTINRTTNYVGLFSRVGSDGTIENVTLRHLSVNGPIGVGGLVGYSAGAVTDVHATGSVNGTDWVGGLIGRNYGEVTNASTVMTITGGVTSVGSTGGVVGVNEESGIVRDSSALGSVDAEYVGGGLVGSNKGSIIESYSTGSVNGSSNVGGVVGDNSGTVNQSYATGTVTGFAVVGGFVGDNRGLVNRSATSATVVAVDEGSTDTGTIAGGLAGRNKGAGVVKRSIATGNVTGTNRLGGLVGRNAGSGGGGLITESTATGNVSGERYVAGIVGDNTDFYFETLGTVNQSYATGTVTGTEEVGGIVGNNFYSYEDFSGSGEIAESYATGSIVGSTDVGGIVGDDPNNNVDGAYWDLNTTNQSTSAGGTGLTTAEMTGPGAAANLTSFDFTSTWETTDSYPTIPGLSERRPPEIAFDYSATDLQVGEEITFTDGSSDPNGGLQTRSWTFGDGTTATGLSPSHNYSGNGTYTVILTVIDDDGDTHSAAETVSVDKPVETPLDTGDLAGSGTSDDPYVITNASELQAIEDDLDAHYILGNDIDASSTAEWNGNKGFDPIGHDPDDETRSPPFTGEFDGAGYSITSLTINRSELDRVGLFGQIGSGGAIRDVNLTDVDVDGFSMLGGLVGKNSGIIKQVSVNGKITTRQYDIDVTESGGDTIGGLVGTNGGEIRQSSVNVTVIGTNYVGGLVGSHGSGNISNVSATGTINGTEFVGGLLGGQSGGSVDQASASGTVTGNSSVGGLIGTRGGTARNVSATSTVSGFQYVGGLVGINRGLITNAATTGGVNGSQSVGGLVGANTGIVENASATGSINGTTKVGGLIGTNRNQPYSYSGTVQDTFAAGSVAGDTETGGLIGVNDGNISDSYWDKNATTQSFSPGNATGLLTTQMTGEAAVGNMSGLDFNATWNSTTMYPKIRTLDDVSQEPTVAEFDYTPVEPRAGETVTFTDRSSTTGGTIQSWSWSFGDGNISTDSSPSNTFKTGTYTVTLTVTDDNGNTYLTAETVSVEPRPAETPLDTGDLAGSGTADDPYVLTNTSELQAIEDDLNASYKLGGNIDAQGTASWDGGTGFDPIGEGLVTDDSVFNGSFDGAGHTISGLTINRSSEYDVGLFGRIGTGGSITNVTVTDAHIVGKTDVGGLVGINDGEISNVRVTGSVTASDYEAGGVVGDNGGSIHNATATASLSANDSVGGLTGLNGGEITDSSATANITGGTDLGGLIGFNTDRVVNTTATGNVSGTDRIGGLIGINKGTVVDAQSHGVVNGSFEVGGLTGQDTGRIKRSTANVSVNATQRAGGLVGNNLRGNITQSTARGSVTVSESGAGGLAGQNSDATIANSSATGTVTGDNTVGGFVGTNLDTGTVRTSYATGDVRGTDSIGGFVGTNWGRVTDSYATGTTTGTIGVGGFVGTNLDTINQSYAAGAVVGQDIVGGFAGRNQEVIAESYARGSVSGSTDVGGFSGDNSATVEASYWDTETSGQTNSPNATGLTTDALTGEAATDNLVGFDFNAIWNSTSRYPVLRTIGDASQQPPVAAFDYSPGEPRAGETVTFTDRSSATAGTIESWSWSFGDGNSSNDRTPTHTFQAGKYTVTLTVTDNVGRTNQVQKELYIAPDVAGNGTSDDPYIVTTARELQLLNVNRSAHYRLGTDIDANGTATWNNDSGFVPIGSSEDGRSFTGSLDGAGHTVTGLTVNRSAETNVGLFGVVGTGGVVENLTLEAQAVSGDEYVGGVVGFNDGGTIAAVTTTGSITGTNFTGGLVGYMTGPSGSEITRSSSTASVSGADSVGGIAGSNNGMISESYAAGSVNGSVEVGGLVGSTTIADTDVVDAYWDTETTNQSASVGGTGLTTAEMTGQTPFDTMTGFEEVWILSDGYPDLRAHSAADTNPPSVSFERSPTNPVVGESVTFDDLSSDADGTIESRNWSFGDNSQSASESATHTYSSPGTYSVTLRVIDNDGIINSTTEPVTVDRDLQGNGTQSDPYILTTVTELQSVKTNLSAHYRLGADINAADTADWNGGDGFDPLGDDPTTSGGPAFSGSFDGAGHTISGLTINRSSEDRVGLFGGVTEGGLVQNVRLVDANISGAAQVGVLVGENRGTINNSSAAAGVSGSTKVGGLVGENRGKIRNSSTEGTVRGSGQRVGGLVGFSYQATVTDSYQAVIDTSSSAATVSGGGIYVGGLVGDSTNSLVTNSSATGNVTGTGLDGEDLGGLIGTNTGVVRNSSASGTVSGDGRMGGLVGINRGTIKRSVAIGAVDGAYTLGGLVGNNFDGTIRNSYATGSVTASSGTFDSIGGLVGSNSGPVRYSYATGEVTSPEGSGGLIGAGDGEVTASYWDTLTTSQDTSASSATRLTTSEMTGWTAVSTMPGLAFGEVWDAQPNDYPELSWQTTSRPTNLKVNFTNSSVTPTSVAAGATQQSSVNVTVENLSFSDVSGEIDLSFDSFDIRDESTDTDADAAGGNLTIDFTGANVSGDTLTVSESVVLDAPNETGIDTVTVADLRRANATRHTQARLTNPNATIATLTVTDAEPASLAASVSNSTVSAGTNTSLTVTTTLTDGTTEDVTTEANVTTTDPGVATIDTETATVSTLTEGSATLTAEYDGLSASTNITVDDSAPPEITALDVLNPNDATNGSVTVRGVVNPGTADLDRVELGVTADFTTYTTVTPIEGSVAGGGSFTAAVPAADLVADGNYSAYAVVADTAGTEVTRENDTVTVDRTPPKIKPRITGLGNDSATLKLKADEGVTIENLTVRAVAAGTHKDRTPDTIPTRVGSTVTKIGFNGSQVDTKDTNFSVEITAADAVGNEITETVSSSISGYQIDANGNATVDPPSVNSSFTLNTTESNTRREAVVSQSDSPPANTSTAPDQVTGQFIEVADIGVDDTNLTTATVRVPLDTVAPKYRAHVTADNVELLRSPDGVESYSSGSVSNVRIEQIDGERFVVGEVPGFSVFTISITDATAPEITDVSVDPGTTPEPDQAATTTFEYTDDLSAINLSATAVTVSGPSSDRVDKQVTDEDATVTVTDLEAGETVSIELTVTDDAGNEREAAQLLTVQAAGGTNDDGGDGGGGGGGQGGGGGGGGPAAIPTPVPEDVWLQERAKGEIQPADGGAVANPGSYTSSPVVETVTFNNPDAHGQLEVREYNTTPSKLGEPPGTTLSTTEVIVPRAYESESARLRFNLGNAERTAVGLSEVDTDSLTVVRHTDEGWTPLDTEVVEASDANIVVEAETPGFSYFAVVEGDGTIKANTVEQLVEGEYTGGTDTQRLLLGGIVLFLSLAVAVTLLFWRAD